MNALVATLGMAQGRATADRARWARTQVEGWSDTASPDVDWAVRTLRAAIEQDAASGAP